MKFQLVKEISLAATPKAELKQKTSGTLRPIRLCNTVKTAMKLNQLKIKDLQPGQNVPAASYLAAYNEISAAYFTLVRHKLIHDEVVSSCC